MANPKSEEARQQYIDSDPFNGFKISDNSILSNLEGRQPCPLCGKSRKFFCYTCYVPIQELEGHLPKVKLPIKIDIIKHKNEIDGKSTAGHAAILAPDDVKIYTYPDIPDYSRENAVLIFPSRKAINIKQLVTAGSYEEILNLYENQEIIKGHNHSLNQSTLLKTLPQLQSVNLCIIRNDTELPITKAIFIDSTWNQSRSIYKDDKLKKIPCVVIQSRISQFWRHQKGSPRWYLATVEAVHQFLVELHLYRWGLSPEYSAIDGCFTEQSVGQFAGLLRQDLGAYCGQYDDLLYFFKHMYDLIHVYYQHGELYAYKRRLT